MAVQYTKPRGLYTHWAAHGLQYTQCTLDGTSHHKCMHDCVYCIVMTILAREAVVGLGCRGGGERVDLVWSEVVDSKHGTF